MVKKACIVIVFGTIYFTLPASIVAQPVGPYGSENQDYLVLKSLMDEKCQIGNEEIMAVYRCISSYSMKKFGTDDYANSGNDIDSILSLCNTIMNKHIDELALIEMIQYSICSSFGNNQKQLEKSNLSGVCEDHLETSQRNIRMPLLRRATTLIELAEKLANENNCIESEIRIRELLYFQRYLAYENDNLTKVYRRLYSRAAKIMFDCYGDNENKMRSFMFRPQVDHLLKRK